jgi:Cache 3/Cache 2 fusion domain
MECHGAVRNRGARQAAMTRWAPKMNNNFAVVDEVAKESGEGMAATLFVKSSDEYIRVATILPSEDGSGRAIGTVATAH